MKGLKVLISCFAIFVLGLIYQLWLPTLSLAYLDGFLFISLCVIVLAALIPLWMMKENSKSSNEYNFIIPTVTIIIFCVILIIGIIAGSKLFHDNTM